jgi:3-hydroxybutyryl-CoA dehydrogenase
MTHAPLAEHLLAGYFADADMLAATGVASAADIDTAMRLGAGYAAGPFAMRGDDGSAPSPTSVPSEAEVRVWQRVAVVGTGHMASGIAEAIARAGRPVTVIGRSADSLERVRSTTAAGLARSVSRGRMTPAEAAAVADRVTLSLGLAHDPAVDLLIEAVAEDVDVKRSVLSEADGVCADEVVFATNTSSFRVAEVMAGVTPRRRSLALHFFNPAAVMKLVEVVAGPGEDATHDAFDWTRAIGKTPVRSADTRGFIVNRLLIPYLNDAVRLYEAGESVEHIDEVMTQDAGLPMGPFALIDLIGIDVTIAALDSMAADGGERLRPAQALRDLARAGRLGRKSGQGFYETGAA